MSSYLKWNKRTSTLLWILVIVSLLATLPLTMQRIQTEQSAKNVEIVFDYRDLLQISNFYSDPRAFLNSQLDLLKQAGVHSLAVYESTLEALQQSHRIRLFSSEQIPLLTGTLPGAEEKNTYLLFTSEQAQQALEPLMKQMFKDMDILVEPWSYDGQAGLKIRSPLNSVLLLPMDPDPLTIRYLQAAGFGVVVRLSDVRPFSAKEMDALLSQLEQDGVKRIIFSGDAVTGFHDDAKQHSLTAMAQLMNKHHIGLAAIEQPPQKQQKGLNKLAYLIDYNVVRLHSILEKEASQPDDRLADRMVLAVKDRNIRMIYLNAEEVRDPINNVMVNSLDNLIRALSGPDGAVKRIQHFGFDLGTAEPFEVYGDHSEWLRGVVALGAVAFIALTLGMFIPALRLLLFVLGLLGAAGLYGLSSSLMLKLLALGAAICGPVLAVILAVKTLQRLREQKPGESASIRLSLWLLLRTSLLSLMGAFYIIGLLHNITFYLVLEQFRGVSLLHLAPIALVAVYLLFFAGKSSLRESLQGLRQILLYKVNILLVLAAVFCGVIILYYLSRTGNAGHASAIERTIRSFLENTLSVRPRSKELLLHPLFVLAVYFALKYRQAVYLLVLAVIAQLSMVDTFAHLHSPLLISLIRGGYGVLFGGLAGLVLIWIWKLAIRGYQAWAPKLKL